MGEDLTERKWLSQVLSYATVAGVAWCVLTDGDEYRFYNATVAIDAEEKLFCRIRLSEDSADDVANTLNLISKANLEGTLLDDYWKSHFVDRRVTAALRQLLTVADSGLTRLILRPGRSENLPRRVRRTPARKRVLKWFIRLLHAPNEPVKRSTPMGLRVPLLCSGLERLVLDVA